MRVAEGQYRVSEANNYTTSTCMLQHLYYACMYVHGNSCVCVCVTNVVTCDTYLR